ncbi:MAG: hypothetical protein HY782_27335 [Chloroflexi bacterium]|nr:hypothetical protein [Chloroflexota bacterium]
MTLKNWMIFKSIVCIVFGVGFVFAAAPLMTLYGATLNATGTLFAQFLGASFVVLAIYLWLARNVTDAEANRAIVLAVFVGDAVGFIVALLAQLSGMFNALGWMIVALWLVLSLGFGYFLVVKPAAQAQPG